LAALVYIYISTTLTKVEIADNYMSVPLEFQPDLRLSTVYQNYTYVLTNSFIAGSGKCSKKHISKLLTYLLSVVKTWHQSYRDSRGGVIQMWILINSKDMFEYIQSRFLSSCHSIKTFDFAIFFIIIPHSKLSKIDLCHLKELSA
jgi:hypothetical protein